MIENEPRLKILVVLGDGGHTAEIINLVGLLGPEYAYSYVITNSDRISENKITIPGPVDYVMRPRAKDEKIWLAAIKCVYSLWQAARLLNKVRPDVVLGSGPAVLIPIALLSKLTRVKLIFVETGSRVNNLSLTGRIMWRLADLFFVQWEQLRERYPDAIFAGRLL